VVLDFAGREQRMTRRDAPLQFDGAAAPGCRLIDGATRDLNLMLRDSAHGAMHAVMHGMRWSPAEQPAAFFAVVAGTLQFGDTLRRLPARSLLCFDQPPGAALAFHADAPAAAPVGYHLSYSA
jgi:environmental stress-induced protein Ves